MGIVGLTVLDANGNPLNGGVTVPSLNGTLIAPLPPQAVPEPATLTLVAGGLLALARVARRRRPA